MSSRLFVITGCPHSELDLPAKAFTALGVSCGHEEIFHTAAFERAGTLFWPPAAAGDASWFAAPVVAKLPAGSVVMHQVRDPLSTIHDLLVHGFFDSQTPSRHFAEDFLPELLEGNTVQRCMRLWLGWHRMIEAYSRNEDLIYRRFRVEDFDEHRAAEQLALIGMPCDAGRARRALEALGETRPRTQVALTWDELPDAPLVAELKAAAERYGYRTTRRTAPGVLSV